MAVAKFAMELALAKAANHGIAIVTVKGSNHYGAYDGESREFLEGEGEGGAFSRRSELSPLE